MGNAEVEESLEQLENHLRQSKSRQQRLRWWGHGVTIAIAAVFAVYFTGLYRTMSDNLSAEKFSESVQNHMTEIAPAITGASVEVMAEVSPVYMDLVGNRADTLIPEIIRALERHAGIFVENMSRFTQDELRTRLGRIVDKQTDEFRKAYADLTDSEIEMFVAETEADLEAFFIEVCEHIIKQSVPEITEMKFLAESLSNPHRERDTLVLTRLFLHKLLLLLDHEIMEEVKT